MAKLHFKYASMNSGKSIDLIKTVYNYEEKGLKTLVVKPSVDTKDGNFISSRVGLKWETDFRIKPNDSIIELFKDHLDDINIIFVDEAQFLTKKQVDELFVITKVLDIPVICYGLRTNFKLESFEGSKRLLELAEDLEEGKTICECGSMARYVGRKKDGEFEVDGDTVVIDGTSNYEYVPMCGECYLKKVLKLDFNDYQKRLGGKYGQNC